MTKEHVKTSSQTSFNIDPEIIVLNKHNFMFALRLEQDNFLKNPYYNISFETRDYYTMQNGT